MNEKDHDPQKPRIPFRKPPRPGRGLMWAGVAVVTISVVLATLPESQDDYSSSTHPSQVSSPAESAVIEDVAATVAALSEATSSDQGAMLQDTIAALAAADRAVEAEAPSTETSASGREVQIKGVTIAFDDLGGWTRTSRGNMVMLAHTTANVVCQLTANVDATPGGLEADANGDEVGYEVAYMGTVLPDGTGNGDLVFRESEAGIYRYAVQGSVRFQMGGQTSSIRFLNAIAMEGDRMARLQCANRSPTPSADFGHAAELSRGMRVRAG